MECPFCKEPIHAGATVCKSCGAAKKFGSDYQTIAWIFVVLSAVPVLAMVLAGGEAAFALVFLFISVPTCIWAFAQAKKHKDGLWYR